MTYTIRSTCRLCDANLPKALVLDLGSTPLANALATPAYEVTGGSGFMPEPIGPVIREQQRYPLYLKQCSACGHCQLPVVVDPKLLFPPEYPYASATGASMREHLERMAKELPVADVYHGYGWEEPGVVVEIGSNDGFLLGEFRKRGYRTIGVDPALTLASSATRGGDLTVPEFFNVQTAHAVHNACGPAGLIVANNVFAHADDLHEIVEGVKALLAPEGRFVFEVGWLADVVRTNNFPALYHEHLSVHSIVPLSNLFARHGLFLNTVERVPTQGGSIRCTVARKQTLEPLGDLVAEDERAYAALPLWPSRVETAANHFASHLTRLKQQGKTIAGYGCSAKSTTLLHVAGIGRETIDFICDDAPTKQGKFSPGKHIPIVPGSWLEEKQPDVCVSLSGNFSEAFKAAHPLYRGEWLEPVLT